MRTSYWTKMELEFNMSYRIPKIKSGVELGRFQSKGIDSPRIYGNIETLHGSLNCTYDFTITP